MEASYDVIDKNLGLEEQISTELANMSPVRKIDGELLIVGSCLLKTLFLADGAV